MGGTWSAQWWYFSHSVASNSCNPMDCSLPSSSAHREEYTGVGCHFLLQAIFPTQGSNSHLLHWQADSFLLRHLRSPWGTLIYVPSTQSALSRERLEKKDQGKQCGRTCKCRRGSAKESRGETRVSSVGERRYSTSTFSVWHVAQHFHTPSHPSSHHQHLLRYTETSGALLRSPR